MKTRGYNMDVSTENRLIIYFFFFVYNKVGNKNLEWKRIWWRSSISVIAGRTIVKLYSYGIFWPNAMYDS